MGSVFHKLPAGHCNNWTLSGVGIRINTAATDYVLTHFIIRREVIAVKPFNSNKRIKTKSKRTWDTFVRIVSFLTPVDGGKSITIFSIACEEMNAHKVTLLLLLRIALIIWR